MMHPQPQIALGSQTYGENKVDKAATASIKAATGVLAEKRLYHDQALQSS